MNLSEKITYVRTILYDFAIVTLTYVRKYAEIYTPTYVPNIRIILSTYLRISDVPTVVLVILLLTLELIVVMERCHFGLP